MFELQRKDWKALYEFSRQILPEGMLVHLWLNIQLDEKLPDRFSHDTCYVDQFPNPTIICCTSISKNTSDIDFATVCLWCDDTEKLTPFLKELENSLHEKYAKLNGIVHGFLFCGIQEKYTYIIRDYFEKNSPDMQVELLPNYQYYMPIEKQNLLLKMDDIQAPDGFYFDKLKIEEAEFVNDSWPHKFPGSLAKVEYRIKNLPNVALRQIGTDELACFEMIHDEHGFMNHLFTVDKFRRRGLATEVELKLARLLIGQTNFVPFKFVVKSNQGGKALTDVSLWWQDLGQFGYYIFCTKNKAIHIADFCKSEKQ